ncbi:MAG: DUF1566 domain-containing protein [Firmicutes bacterium]|nr:DUF1566 domain-containing protein [Bacillota bacterium]
MKLNNRGFAVTSIIYSMLVLFLALLLLITSNLASRKVLFDKEKNEILDKLNGSTLCELVGDNDLSDSVTIGDKYSCDFGRGYQTFYILGINEDTANVFLIMDRNYDMSTQSWCDQEGDNPHNNVCNGDGLKAKLDAIAFAWSELDRNQIGLPSVSQLGEADGLSEDEYWRGPDLSSEWLYSYPGNSSWHEESPWGYWTSTPSVEDSSWAWYVDSYGSLYYDGAVDGYEYGVRPVVNISLDELGE